MLRTQPWLTDREAMEIERAQASEEGRWCTELEAEWSRVQALEDEDEREKVAGLLYDAVQRREVAADYPFVEPSDWEGIAAQCAGVEPPLPHMSRETLDDRVLGGWLGRICGCLLGQPIEGWRRARIQGLLRATGNAPVHAYISSQIDPAIRERYEMTDGGGAYGNAKKSWINNIEHAPEDDDTNYTLIGMVAMERYGPNFTAEDMAELWLGALPILHVCTAERVAYKNLVNRRFPPESASYRNPYREWIGAQIRGDAFGYASPGQPVRASRMCHADASISHVKNGIYGEMWVGAMLALAFIREDIPALLRESLDYIPARSRLHKALLGILKRHADGATRDQVIEELVTTYHENSGHDWCHTISNACIVAAALLYGEGDLETTIGIAIWPGFDTDCNAATAGSVVGVLRGAAALDPKWTSPLNDHIRSGVDGLGLARISDIARRMADLAAAFAPELIKA